MTTLNLLGLWMAPVSDLSDTLHFAHREISDSTTVAAGVRRYAGGRDRIISTPGSSRVVPFTAISVARSDWLDLVDRIGVLQLFRDSRGRAIYGLVSSVSASEWRSSAETLASVSFTVTSVSHSEIV